MSQSNYASFYQRFVATLIDGVILSLVIGLTLGQQVIIDENTFSEPDNLLKNFVYLVLNTVLGWLYFAILESSQIPSYG